MTKTFQIYRSSAGSGKTRTLAKEYIKLALSGQADYYRFILAVTFANKATQEMKERIVLYLDDFAKGRDNNLRNEIKDELGLDDETLVKKSQEVLSLILHRYSQFSISTIDAFFQKVIRSFTREAGLLGNFRLEVDNDFVLDEVIGALMDELGPQNKELTNWVVQFSRDQLADGDNWNIQYALKRFSKEIFKDAFKSLEDRILNIENIQSENLRVLKVLRDQERKFIDPMKALGKQAMDILNANGVTVDDFSYGDAGTPFKYFRNYAHGKYVEVGQRILGAVAGSSSWAKKGLNAKKLTTLAESELMPILREMVDFDKKNVAVYNSVAEVLKDFYAYGLIADITRKLRNYREENNVMLLSDASKFLNNIIHNSDTPFIYEKVGSHYRNYLIDEFQDTSEFQWKNFVPLLKEAADQNYTNLIVGDVKQSIYRWRGGDLELLQNGVTKEFGETQVSVIPLNTNYRSAGNIIEFNNEFFEAAAAQVSQEIQADLPVDVFSDVAQKISKWDDQGFVRVRFIEKDADDEGAETQILKLLPGWLETLQDQGAELKDIAILVRKNEEGQRIANHLLQFRNSPDAKPGYEYDVVSNESLKLDTSLSVNVLIAALRFLKNPEDKIARGQLAYEAGTLRATDELFLKAGQDSKLGEVLPEAFLKNARHMKRLSLFELTEELIKLFDLGSRPEELSYLQAFQDLVLGFSAKERSDIDSFLEWWEMYKDDKDKSIKVSDSVNAVNILTIHMSKGLQFKYVIVPFCTWRLNHEFMPLMWVQANEKPFDSLGPLSVRFSKDLEKTLFAADYHQEHTKAYLDNLNLLYVAFTRAEWGLIAFAPLPKADKLSTVGDLMYKMVRETASLSTDLKITEFERGEIGAMPSGPVEESPQPVQLERYVSTDWKDKLIIKREGSEFFEETASVKRSKINRGILIHQVMSRIEYKAEAADKLADFFLEHALPDEDKEFVTKEVNEMLSHPQMSNWFSKEWTIKAEAQVLLPGGHQKRIDRIMLGKTRTVIVDYKSGEKSAADRQQVEEYATLLIQMGYPNVQAYLVYLRDKKVEEVISKSSLSLF